MFSYNIPLKTNDHKHQGNDKEDSTNRGFERLGFYFIVR